MVDQGYAAKLQRLDEVAERLRYEIGGTRSIGDLTIRKFLAPYNQAFDDIKDRPPEHTVEFPSPDPHSDITMVLNDHRVVATKTENPPQSVRGNRSPGRVEIKSVSYAGGDDYILDSVRTSGPQLYHTEGPDVLGWGDFSVRRAVILSPETPSIAQDIVTEPANFLGMLLTETPEGYTLDSVSVDYKVVVDPEGDKFVSYPQITVALPYSGDISEVVIDPRKGEAVMWIGDEETLLEPDDQGNFYTPDGMRLLSLHNGNDQATHSTVMLSEPGLSVITEIRFQKQIEEQEFDDLDAIVRSENWFESPIAPHLVQFRQL
tara:strand:+ start:2853 stop:3806 length:954 start_codon:yes stop_codon:yes gene_type:complete